MPALAYLKLTDCLACEAVARAIPQAVYGVLHANVLTSARDTLAVEDPESLQFEYPRIDGFGVTLAITAEMRAGRVLTVVWSDGSFDEWRVRTVTSGRGESGLVSVECVALWLDLVERADGDGLGWVSDVAEGIRNFEYALTERTPSDILTTVVLPACPSWVAIGTVDPTYVIPSLSVSRQTPGAVVLAVRDALRAVDVPCEVRLRRNGRTNYLLDLVTQVGASAVTPVFHPSNSLVSLKGKADATLQATRVLVKGASAPDGVAGIWGRARWRCGAPSGTTIVLTDRNGGAGPVAFDGQFVGMYLLRVQTGRTFLITASSAAGGSVTLASVSTIAADEDVEFRVTEPHTNTRSTVTRYAVSAVPDGTHITCSGNPIVADGQFTDWYARIWTASSGGAVITTTRVTGSVAGTDALTVATSSGVTTSHFVEFVQLDGAGEVPSFVDHPVYVQPDPVGFGVKVMELSRNARGVPQLMRNPWMRAWSNPAAAPDGWEYFFPNLYGAMIRNADPAFTRYGGYSLQTQWDGVHVNVGGVRAPRLFPNQGDLASQLSARVRVYFTGYSGAMVDGTYFALYAAKADGTHGLQLGRVDVAPLGTGTGATEVDNNAWVELKIEGISLVPAGDPASVATAPYGVIAEFYPGQTAAHSGVVYIDSIEAFPFATCPDDALEFGDATSLLQSGNRQLATSASPPVFYTFDVLDLERAFPIEHKRLKLTLGGTVRAPDADYGIDVTVRLLQLQRDLLDPSKTTLTLANRPTRVTSIQSIGAQRQTRLISAIESGAVGNGTAQPQFVALVSDTVLPHDAEIAVPAGVSAVVTMPSIATDVQDTTGASVTFVPPDPAVAPRTVITVGTPPSRRRASTGVGGGAGNGGGSQNGYPVDIRRFGLAGNGLTDDTTRFLSALDSGEELHIPAGRTFLISGTLDSAATGLTLSGRGRILLAPGANCPILRTTNAQFISVVGVEFDGNKAHQSTAAPLLWIRNGAYGAVERVRLHDSKGQGLLLENMDGSANADEVNVAGCYVFSNAGHGLELNYSGSGTVQGVGDCVIGPRNHINYNGGHGIYQHGGSANTIQGNNVLTNDGHGVFLEGVPGVFFVTRDMVTGNQIRNNGGSGLLTSAGSTLYGGGALQVIGNQFHYNNRLALGASNADIWDTNFPIILGNYFGDLDFTARAIYGLQLSRCTDARITGNTFANNATADTAFVNSSSYLARGNFGLADN